MLNLINFKLLGIKFLQPIIKQKGTLIIHNSLAVGGAILADTFNGVEVRVYYNSTTGKFDVAANTGRPALVARALSELANLLRDEGVEIGNVATQLMP